MKRFLRTVISLAVVALMVMNLGVFVFAEDTNSKTVYTCLGDSNAAGYGLDGYIFSRIPVDNAYHSLVANGLNAELRDYAGGGYRSHEIRYLIDPEYELDWTYSEFCMAQSRRKKWMFIKRIMFRRLLMLIT